jgi:hypothetical protein
MLTMKRMLLIACAFGLGAGAAIPQADAGSDAITGFGSDIPLILVVQQIVPPTYSVTYSNGVDRDTKISWQSGPDWQSVLRSADVHGRHLSVDVAGNSVVISDADAAYTGPIPAGGLASPSDTPGSSARPVVDGTGLVVIPYHQPAPASAYVATPVSVAPPVRVQQTEVVPAAIVTAPAPAPRMTARQRRAAAAAARIAERAPMRAESSYQSPPTVSLAAVNAAGTVWHARADQTLDQVLGDWADKAGWTLIFKSPMIYELQASADFEGNFLEAASSLIRSVRAVPQPIATFYRGNNTLVVTNNSEQMN